MAQFVFINDRNRERYLKIIAPAGKFLARMGIHPNVLSFAGLVFSALAGLLYSTGAFFWAAWVVVLAGVCDSLDGLIARQTQKTSTFGAFFDSTLDRYGDMFLLLGLAYHFAGGIPFFFPGMPRVLGGEASPWTVMVIFLALTGSFMVSYARARAEGLGIPCKEGMMQRPERITLLIIGSLLGAIPQVGPWLLKFVLLLLAVSTNLTAVYRIIHVRNRILKGNP
ncbi:MAG: CDP-alcohol phosphatidyltransferase family protein [Deltaproteobacteria bacterium]|nr:CDP-alcohol phosphatidyltransferase family protein [Deltaproteobacteria bacterium]MBW2017402.1 CDP-alcohol phosphatidyltransferase family protein [Deltaproteobacteria bacterium]MBW2130210.1 CDP-alcohol phosphatidyltransferase family protein [Deltaproteobacteria bacterium]MBW2302963.1 CDP-alcohol phosphatidyltransferase family protein [Deltaproteobacteria bacterium]